MNAILAPTADCHMGVVTSDRGYGTGTYSDHYLVSPLEKPEILATCVKCHGDTDMAEKVFFLFRYVQATDQSTDLFLFFLFRYVRATDRSTDLFPFFLFQAVPYEIPYGLTCRLLSFGPYPMRFHTA